MFLSAEQGFPAAIHHLGLFLVNGICLSRDKPTGLSMLKLSSSMGSYSSLVYLRHYAKLGELGFGARVRAYSTMAVREFFAMLAGFIPYATTKRKALIYVFHTEVENKIRREIQGEEISAKYEVALREYVTKLNR